MTSQDSDLFCEDQEASTAAELLEWAAGTLLIDPETDLPRLVYHGTSAKEPFGAFDHERQGQTAGVGGGFFFTDKRETALDVYGWRSGGVVLEVYLRLENPLTLDAYLAGTGKSFDVELGENHMNPTNYFDEESKAILEFAREHGHDGVMFVDDSGDEYAADLYVVFDASQIRSAGKVNGAYLGDHATSDLKARSRPRP